MAFTHPRTIDDFDAHWSKILRDPSVVVRAILARDSLVGCISCFKSNGLHHVGYWVGKEFWGWGIASRALKLLLEEVRTRPLHSRVAVSNIASIRVLEKCGFCEVRREWSPATERYIECKEVVMKLGDLEMKNLFANLPENAPLELVTVLVDSKSVRFERIVSTGHNSPNNFWYDQDEHEWVIVLKGEAKLLFDGDVQAKLMKPGDFINIPAHRKHRVEWTTPDEPTIWLAVYY